MAKMYSLFFQPSVETKSNWVVSGAATDLAAVQKGRGTVAAPAVTSYIESTTNNQGEGLGFPNFTLPEGEYVSFVRAHMYATTQANHTITFSAYYTPSGGSASSVAGAQNTTIPASSSAAWFKTPKLAPRRDLGTFDGVILTQADLDSLTVGWTLTEGSAQAATSKVYAVVLEVGVSTMEHLDVQDKLTFGPVTISEAGFFGAHTGERFNGWGYQYENYDWWANASTAMTRLMEQKRHQANFLRVHVPFGPYMTDATTPNETKFAQFERFLDQCEGMNIRLDVTGLNLYDPALRPAWLDALSEANRWATFGVFWKRLAQACAGSPAVVFYGLINEPVVPIGGASSVWYGGNLGGFDYFAFIVKDPGVRTGEEIVDDWFDVMETAIRTWDPARAMGPCYPFDLTPDASVPQWNERSTVLLPHLYASNTYENNTLPTLIEDYYDLDKPVVLEESGSLGTLTAENNKGFWIAAQPYLASTLTNWSGYIPDPSDPDIPFAAALSNSINTAPFMEASREALGEELERVWLGDWALHENGWTLEAIDIDAPEQRSNAVRAGNGSEPTERSHYDERVVNIRLSIAEDLSGLSIDRAFRRIGIIRQLLEEAPLLAVEGNRGLPMVWHPSGAIEPVTLYVQSGQVVSVPKQVSGDSVGYFQDRPVVNLRLVCDPFLYAAPVTLVGSTATGPLASVTFQDVLGDVPAPAELTLREVSGAERRFVEWGMQQRNYTLSGLVLDSDDVTITGYSGSATTRSGAYDPNATGNSVVRVTPTSTPLTICGMSDLTQMGRFRLRARLFATDANAPGDVGFKVRLRYRFEGGQWIALPWVEMPLYGSWCEPELGTITIPQSGDPLWDWEIDCLGEGAGTETLDFDYLAFLPVDEGYGKASSASPSNVTNLQIASDPLNNLTPAAALNGRAAPTGGTWATSVVNISGSTAPDFVGSTPAGSITRANTSDTAKRFALLSSTDYETVEVGGAYWAQRWTNETDYIDVCRRGVVARYVDGSNYLLWGSGFGTVGVYLIAHVAGTFTAYSAYTGFLPEGAWLQFRLVVYNIGICFVSLVPVTYAGNGVPTFGAPLHQQAVYIPACDVGGALASGQIGVEGYNLEAATNVTFFKNFYATTTPPVEEPVIPRGARIRFGATNLAPAERERDTNRWARTPYRGARFWLPPALGDLTSNSRLAWRARRADLDNASADNITDQTEYRISYTPRYLDVPRV